MRLFPDGTTDVDSIFCPDALSSRVSAPCLLELIWSYWHEEGMLVQTMNAISRRFQNVRGPGDRDPLAHLEIDPLRPLNNLLWGYVQDEQNLLTVKRRAYEYDHHYGLTTLRQGGAAACGRPTAARSSSKASTTCCTCTSVFYKEDNDTTVIADGFPLLNALREVHLLLAQGAHNQFGDLPWTARAEMLMQQWLLSQPQMREFLQSRPMVPYKEPWMAQVDTMKTLQGWSDVTVTHFRDLGDLWRADPAVDPLRRLDRYQRRGLRQELGALLASGDPELHPCLSHRDGNRSDQSRHRRLHHAGRASAEAAGDAAGAVRCVPVLDFTSALYLGLRHPSPSLRPWSGLTTGKPAALEPPPGSAAIAGRFAALVGCERATPVASTLHLFWDLFGLLARDRVRIYMDEGTYAIARWGVERAAARGVPVRRVSASRRHHAPRS